MFQIHSIFAFILLSFSSTVAFGALDERDLDGIWTFTKVREDGASSHKLTTVWKINGTHLDITTTIVVRDIIEFTNGDNLKTYRRKVLQTTSRGIYKLEQNTLVLCQPITEAYDPPATWDEASGVQFVTERWKRTAERADDKVDGDWQLESRTIGGKLYPAATFGQTSIDIKDGVYTLTSELTRSGTFSIDTTVTPWTLDLTYDNGGVFGGFKRQGLIELERDKLRVNLGFTTRPDSLTNIQDMRSEQMSMVRIAQKDEKD
jgi:uncharacterized protein (TIGR03067 family)